MLVCGYTVLGNSFAINGWPLQKEQGELQMNKCVCVGVCVCEIYEESIFLGLSRWYEKLQTALEETLSRGIQSSTQSVWFFN